jgi:hypothetical protein
MPKKKSANKGPALVAFPEHAAAMEMLEVEYPQPNMLPR